MIAENDEICRDLDENCAKIQKTKLQQIENILKLIQSVQFSTFVRLLSRDCALEGRHKGAGQRDQRRERHLRAHHRFEPSDLSQGLGIALSYQL